MVVVSQPAPDLAPRIAMFWAIPHEPGPGNRFHEFFPDCSTNLVIRLSPAGCRVVLMGPATEKAAIELAGRGEYFGVRFRTGQAPRLADVVPAELTNTHVDVARIMGERVDSLGERFSSLSDLGSRQRLLEDLLRRSPLLARDERCRRASLLLEERGGRLRVEDLASGLGLHPRSLERLFLDHLGIAPKRLTRLVRLRHLLMRLHERSFGSLAELAYDCGYADQSHMIRDFKALTGRLPGDEDASMARPLASARESRFVHRVAAPQQSPPSSAR